MYFPLNLLPKRFTYPVFLLTLGLLSLTEKPVTTDWPDGSVSSRVLLENVLLISIQISYWLLSGAVLGNWNGFVLGLLYLQCHQLIHPYGRVLNKVTIRVH
nr:hypothetical protein [Spirosoma sp. KNUC1025]